MGSSRVSWMNVLETNPTRTGCESNGISSGITSGVPIIFTLRNTKRYCAEFAFESRCPSCTEPSSRRAETGGARGPVKAQRSAADARNLRAEPISQRVTVRLFQRIQNVLGGLVAIGILNRRVDSRKNPKVVQTALALRDLTLRQRIARIETDSFVHKVQFGGL